MRKTRFPDCPKRSRCQAVLAKGRARCTPGTPQRAPEPGHRPRMRRWAFFSSLLEDEVRGTRERDAAALISARAAAQSPGCTSTPRMASSITTTSGRASRIQGGGLDAVVGRQAADEHSPDIAVSQSRPIPFPETRIRLEIFGARLGDHMADLRHPQLRVECGSVCVGDAVRRPDAPLGFELTVIGRVPVPGGDGDPMRHAKQPIDRRDERLVGQVGDR